MAAFEVIALDTATPQLRAPGAGDTYTHPRQSLFLAGTAAAPGIAGNSDDNTGMLWPAADTLAWATGGSEQMRLNSTGLGIGTNNPGAKVQAAVADGSYSVAASGTTKGLRVEHNTVETRIVGVDNTLTGSFQPLSLGGSTVLVRVSGSTLAATFDSSGNLGIGTSSPAGRLHIAQTNAGGSQFLTLQTTNTTQGNATIRWQGSAGTNQAFIGSYFTTADTGNLEFGNGSTTNMQLTSSGNLGLGTASPFTRIESVYGTNAAINTSSPNATTSLTLSAADGGAVANGNGALLQFRPITNRGAVVAIGGINTTTNKDGDAALVFYRNSGNGTIAEAARITAQGNVIAGASAALATTATNGFLYVPTCAGTPTGVPTTITGMAPIVVDTTNNKLYFYSGGAWRDAGP
jgi:hypothetical protein